MRVDLATPWMRKRITPTELGTLRILLPDDFRITLRLQIGQGSRPFGPVSASLYLGDKPVGNAIAGTPYNAAVAAIALADPEEHALAQQLAASLRALGIDADEIIAKASA